MDLERRICHQLLVPRLKSSSEDNFFEGKKAAGKKNTDPFHQEERKGKNINLRGLRVEEKMEERNLKSPLIYADEVRARRNFDRSGICRRSRIIWVGC